MLPNFSQSAWRLFSTFNLYWPSFCCRYAQRRFFGRDSPAISIQRSQGSQVGFKFYLHSWTSCRVIRAVRSCRRTIEPVYINRLHNNGGYNNILPIAPVVEYCRLWVPCMCFSVSLWETRFPIVVYRLERFRVFQKTRWRFSTSERFRAYQRQRWVGYGKFSTN